MKNFLRNFRKIAGFPFVFLIIMILFLGITLGTAGSVASFGKSFELQFSTDTNWSWVVFEVSAPKTVDEDGKETDMDVRLHDVYINLGQIYSREATASLELQWGSTGTEADNFFRLSKMKTAVVHNPYYVPEEGAEETKPKDSENHVYDAAYRWIAPFGVTELEETSSYRVMSSPKYFKLVLPKVGNKYQSGNILVNEIVFIGEVYKDSKGTGEYVVLPAKIDARTYVPDADREAGMARAETLIDAQKMPVVSESSYYRFGEEEQKILHTVAEMRMGNSFVPGDTYVGDTTYNSLGLDLACLGTLIFGMSPFGLRFFNVLASFGILVVGFFFVRRLFSGSDKAGLSFAIIYALCGVSVSLAHIASPIMLGVFFLLSSLSACYRFYASGMKKSLARETIPLLVSGLAGALAILVNGAFLIPVAGVVVLFGFGVAKQYKKDRLVLDEAIEFAEAERAKGIPAISEDGVESEGNKKVRTALKARSYDMAASIAVFVCSLDLALFVLSILFALPAIYAVGKIYYGIAGASPNIFWVVIRLFFAGFRVSGANGWNYLYPVFTGSGDKYAVTLGMMNFTASLLGLLGIAFAVYRIVKLAKNKTPFTGYVSVMIPLVGLAVSLLTGAFAGGSVAFVFLANLFAFMLVAGGGELFQEEGAKQAKAVFIVKIVALALLVACFALTAVFTFSVPLPAWFMGKIF